MAAHDRSQRRDSEKHRPPHPSFRPHPVTPASTPPRSGRDVPEREFWKELERRHERHAPPGHP